MSQRDGVLKPQLFREPGLLFVSAEHFAKLVVEPAGAAGAAALMGRRSELDGCRNLACVLSGGNVTTETFVAALQTHASLPDVRRG